MEDRLRGAADQVHSRDDRLRDILLEAKQHGFSDKQLAFLWHSSEREIRGLRKEMGVVPTYKLVDTCAAEFEAYTPYYYSTYESLIKHLTTDDTDNTDKNKTGTFSSFSSSVLSVSSVVKFDNETKPPA